MKNGLLLIFVLLLFSTMTLSSCRKKIDIPNGKCERLFGTWEWVYSSGGFAGGILTPSSENYTKTVSYTNKGIYKMSKNGKKKTKYTYSFQLGETIFYGEEEYLIKYAGAALSKKEILSDSFYFNGQDTLVLRDECFDCYSHVYVRK